MIRRSDLTRHAVCLGMTGSGKTGLCIGLLEDLAAQGVPILAIDPKGDLANLALVFRELTPASFAPWTASPDDAAAAAATWAAAHPDGATAAWLDAVEVRVLSPGSESGTPVDVLTCLTRAPAGLDPEGLRELVTGAVSALLGLIGRPADPLRDPAAILLARLLGDAFARGEELPVDRLIPAVVDPPFTELGFLAVDTFMPRDARLRLAGELNAVVASPAFAPFRTGVPLDVAAWLSPSDGPGRHADPTGSARADDPGADRPAAPHSTARPRTPITVVYLAHLDEPQRQFFLTLLLHRVVAWSRRLPGASDLTALVYLDEVMGLLPPHPKDPPTKWPVLALMKQARAVGVGVMLATQNPVDLDYKALSNAATWLIGRLQTRQDRARVLDGLSTAGVDIGDLDDTLANLPPRTFIVRDGGTPRTVRSRHTYAWLRGPLTRGELSRLPRQAVPNRPTDGLLGAAPPAPDGLPARWLDAPARADLDPHLPPADGVWRPVLVLRWAVRFDDPDFVEDTTVHQLLPGADEDAPVLPIALPDEALLRQAPAGGRYTPLPGWLFARGAVARLKDTLRDRVVREAFTTSPTGDRVVADREDVRALGAAVVWVR
jgi:hypothetical protein